MKLTLPILPSDRATFGRWAGEIRRKDFFVQEEFVWSKFEPTLTGGMTLANIYNKHSRYAILNKTIFMECHIGFDITAGAANYLYLTPPTQVEPSDSLSTRYPSNFGVSFYYPSTAVIISGTGVFLNESQIQIGRYDGGNFAVANGYDLRISGYYRRP